MFRVAVADWDETITCHDTIQHVAAAAYARKPHYRPHFDHFTEVYAAAYNEFARTATPEPSFAGELRYQKQLRKVEMALINEIERLRLFQGVEPLDLQRQAVHAQLQPHFVEFARVCQLRAVPLVILSLNWSHVFIEAALRLHGVLLSNVEIISNDLEFSDNVATGLFDRAVTVRTGADKWPRCRKSALTACCTWATVAPTCSPLSPVTPAWCFGSTPLPRWRACLAPASTRWPPLTVRAMPSTSQPIGCKLQVYSRVRRSLLCYLLQPLIGGEYCTRLLCTGRYWPGAQPGGGGGGGGPK